MSQSVRLFLNCYRYLFVKGSALLLIICGEWNATLIDNILKWFHSNSRFRFMPETLAKVLCVFEDVR